MALRAVIFDMDGTLAETDQYHKKSVNLVLNMHGVFESFDWNKSKIGSGTEYMEWTKLKKKYSIEQPIKELMAQRFSLFKILVEKYGLSPMPGVYALIRHIYNYQLGIASCSTTGYIDYILQMLNLKGYFGEFVSAADDDVLRSKPYPDIYLKAAQRLCAAPDECIAIEDSVNGVLSACSAGIYCIGFINKYFSSDDLLIAGADTVVDDLSQAIDIVDKWSPFNLTRGDLEKLFNTDYRVVMDNLKKHV